MDTLGSLIPYDAAASTCSSEVLTTRVLTFLIKGDPRLPDQFRAIEPRLKVGEGFWAPSRKRERRSYRPTSARTRILSGTRADASEMAVPIISNDVLHRRLDLEAMSLTHTPRTTFQYCSSSLRRLRSSSKGAASRAGGREEADTGAARIARQVQLDLLPSNDPIVDGFDVSAYIFSQPKSVCDYYYWVKI